MSLKCLNNMEVKHRIFIPNIDTKTESEVANHWRVQSLTIWKFREQNMRGKDNITLKFSNFPPNFSKLTFRLVFFLFPLHTFPPDSHKFAIISVTKTATLARGSRTGCSMTLPFGASTGRWNRTWAPGSEGLIQGNELLTLRRVNAEWRCWRPLLCHFHSNHPCFQLFISSWQEFHLQLQFQPKHVSFLMSCEVEKTVPLATL